MSAEKQWPGFLGTWLLKQNVPVETTGEVVIQLAAQLIKDMEMAGMDFRETTEFSKAVFWSELADYLKREMMHQPERFRAFLYRVDLDETKLTECMAGKNPEQVLWLILEREWRKITSRQQYG